MTEYTIQKAKQIPDFQTHCVQTLNDSFPSLNEKPTMFQIREIKPPAVKKQSFYDYGFASLIFIIFACLFLIFGLLFRQRASQFVLMLQSCFSRKIFETITKDGKLINKYMIVPSFILYALIIALMCERAVIMFGIDLGLQSWGVLLFAMLVVAGFSLIKLILIRFFGLIFSNRILISLHITNQIVFFTADFLLLIFPVFCSFFLVFYLAEVFLYISFSIFTLLSIIRVLRGIVILLKNRISLNLYLFLYLCIVEIVPLLIVIKILFSYI